MVASEGDQCWLHHHDNTANFNKHLLDKVSVSVSVNTVVTETDRGPLCPGQLQEDPVGGHAAAAGARGAARQGDRHQEDAQRRRGQKVGRTYKKFINTIYTGAKVGVNKWNNIRRRVYLWRHFY